MPAHTVGPASGSASDIPHSICFLVRNPHDNPENGVALARAALGMGLAVAFGAAATLALHGGDVTCSVHTVTQAARQETAQAASCADTNTGGAASGTQAARPNHSTRPDHCAQPNNPACFHDLHVAPQGRTVPLASFGHVQVLSFGPRASFLDYLQLLRLLAEGVPVTNSPDALMHLNSKYLMAGMGRLFPTPLTHASTDADTLWSVVSQSDEPWIVKPPAEAFGRDVFLISRADTNARAILQSMTGHGTGRYCLLQQYVPQIRQGEVRVLLAGGRVVGQYRRRAAQDHRTNLAQGAVSEPCELTPEERALCDRLGTWLLERGVVFAGVDLAYPYIIECNVLSPGGIATIAELTGHDLSGTVLRGILGIP
ncbi:hypothetical protein DSM19430T_14940 [Desulfovibrio psychrotolerans]|uniref:ATP-grasp domain-containing protein n=2 Tax=Desulfovibrio psychrotolerans TaxID=415242 RepID=A0A7J0BSX5_9BACT|nr:hypothetical protein DSM19430T_14940 [Desulfovibrio psychrotolerans]